MFRTFAHHAKTERKREQSDDAPGRASPLFPKSEDRPNPISCSIAGVGCHALHGAPRTTATFPRGHHAFLVNQPITKCALHYVRAFRLQVLKPSLRSRVHDQQPSAINTPLSLLSLSSALGLRRATYVLCSVVAEQEIMGLFFARSFLAVALLCVLLPCHAKLSTKFYAKTCPNVGAIARSVMAQAVAREPRMGASIIRLFFHDCFVNGCDASILLDDTPTFTGEKNAGANVNSVRGYEVIDAIKARVEAACKATVSCADIVALASRDAVNLLGGPTWNVQLGRKDSRTASQSAANANLPGPSASAASLVSAFAAKGLSARDMTALSGAHTVGRVRCLFFRGRIYTEPNINATFAAARRQTCPQTGGDSNLAPFDDQTPDAFDNAYYKNLVAQRGLLHSDQELFNGGSQDALVRKYSGNAGIFAGDFAKAMVKMGGLMPAAGTPTEVRLNCRKMN